MATVYTIVRIYSKFRQREVYSGSVCPSKPSGIVDLIPCYLSARTTTLLLYSLPLTTHPTLRVELLKSTSFMLLSREERAASIAWYCQYNIIVFVRLLHWKRGT